MFFSYYRLLDYDGILEYKNSNNDYQHQEIEYVFPGPADLSLFKDLNSSSILDINKTFYEDYFNSIGIHVNQERGANMYKEKYLLCLRIARFNDCTYLKGKVAAEQRKQVVYTVDTRILRDKTVSDVRCECAAGVGPAAHCKHVIVVFKASADFKISKTYLVREVCTEKLQSFHKPKRFTYSPVKAKDLQIPRPK